MHTIYYQIVRSSYGESLAEKLCKKLDRAKIRYSRYYSARIPIAYNYDYGMFEPIEGAFNYIIVEGANHG